MAKMFAAFYLLCVSCEQDWLMTRSDFYCASAGWYGSISQVRLDVKREIILKKMQHVQETSVSDMHNFPDPAKISMWIRIQGANQMRIWMQIWIQASLQQIFVIIRMNISTFFIFW